MSINKTIVSLDFWGNRINCDCCALIETILRKNDGLTDLNLGSNLIRSRGCIYLTRGLKINTSLKSLNLKSKTVELTYY
eukprot:gene11601-4844_t